MGVTAATIAVIGIAAAGITAFGQLKESEERAKAEEFNADVSRRQAELVKARGRLDVLRQRKTAIAFTSTQQALFSKAGVVLSGSPLQVIQETAAQAELDILTTEFNAFTEASRLRSEARERERTARAERTVGRVRAGKTLLTAATSAALKFGGGGETGTKFERIGSFIGVRK